MNYTLGSNLFDGQQGVSTAVPAGLNSPTAQNPTTTAQNNPFVPVTATSLNTAVPAAPVSGFQNSSVPTASAIPTTDPSGVQNNGVTWNTGSNSVIGDFQDTYGKGSGTAITQVLQNLGSNTDAAVQATIANTDLAAGKQYANIQSQESAAGITPNSSTAALAAGDFYSGVNSSLQQTIGTMEMSEEDQLLQSLTTEGQEHGHDYTAGDAALDFFTGGIF